MPTTKKESIYFGMMMCFGMVVGMTFYNLLINDLFRVITLKESIIQFLIAFMVALALDLLIVGPLAKKIVFKLPFDKTKIPVVVITMSACMVLGMAFFMSFYGLITANLHHGAGMESFVQSYLSIFIKNFAFALPLQLVIMGPIVRFFFLKFVKGNQSLKSA